MAQFSLAIALINSLAIAGLGLGFSLLQNKEFLLTETFKYVFAIALLLLLAASLLSFCAVITRLLDFRLTARKVRNDTNSTNKKPCTIFLLGPVGYGKASWGLFWASCLTFIFGLVMLTVTISVAYSDRLN